MKIKLQLILFTFCISIVSCQNDNKKTNTKPEQTKLELKSENIEPTEMVRISSVDNEVRKKIISKIKNDFGKFMPLGAYKNNVEYYYFTRMWNENKKVEYYKFTFDKKGEFLKRTKIELKDVPKN